MHLFYILYFLKKTFLKTRVIEAEIREYAKPIIKMWSLPQSIRLFYWVELIDTVKNIDIFGISIKN